MGQNRDPLIAEAYAMRRDGDRRGALRLYLEAAEALTDKAASRASALRHAGDLHMELGETAEAGRRYDDAWAIYRALNPAPDLDMANCLRPMALWHEAADNGDEAIRLWREARQWYEKAAISGGYELQPAFDECDRHLKALNA